MKKNIKKKNDIHLKELFEEACDEINSRGETILKLSEELEYYYGFIEYHKLEDLFLNFKKNAHKEEYPDLPFDHYTL